MLLSLAIRDFVIVDTLELDFTAGFTVLTGETGAGKSIIIDALSLLLGGRGDGSLVRAGCERAELSARDVYLMIAGMSYFYLSNRFTLSAFLGEQLDRPEALTHWEQFVIDAVLRNVAASPAA